MPMVWFQVTLVRPMELQRAIARLYYSLTPHTNDSTQAFVVGTGQVVRVDLTLAVLEQKSTKSMREEFIRSSYAA